MKITETRFPDLSKTAPEQAIAWYTKQCDQAWSMPFGAHGRRERMSELAEWKHRIMNPWLMDSVVRR